MLHDSRSADYAGIDRRLPSNEGTRMSIESIEHGITISKNIAIGSGGATFLLGLNINQFAALGGLTVAILSLIATIFFNIQRNRILARSVEKDD